MNVRDTSLEAYFNKVKPRLTQMQAEVYQLFKTSYVEEKTYVPTTLGSPTIQIDCDDYQKMPFTTTIGDL